MKENNTYHEHFENSNLPDSLRVNPFLVPHNYFEEQSSHLLSICKLKHKNIADGFVVPEGYFNRLAEETIFTASIDSLRKEESFQVPEDYFLNLESQLMSQVKIESLETESFEVPKGYFDNLTDSIFTKIAEDKLSQQVSGDGFTVPDAYFEEANEQILASVALDKLVTPSEIKDFTVPSGYFDQLTEKLMDNVSEKKIITLPKTEVKTIKPNRFKVYAWLSSVAAACLAIFVGIGIYNNNNLDEQFANKNVSLQEIPEDEIIKYLANYSDGTDLSYYAEYIYEPEESKGIGYDIEAEDLKDYLNNTL